MPAVRQQKKTRIRSGCGSHVWALRLSWLRAGVHGVADGRERGVGVGAERRDGPDADHDDQGQHHRVLNGRRAVFTLDEIHHRFAEHTHGTDPFMSFWVRSESSYPFRRPLRGTKRMSRWLQEPVADD